MELKLSSNFSGKPVSVVVPIEKVIEVFWPKDEKPPISLTVSTMRNFLLVKKPKSPIPAFGLRPIMLKAIATVLGSASSCRTIPTTS